MIQMKIDRKPTGVGDLYNQIAEKLGAYDLEKCIYDCTKIEVSSDIRQSIEDAYEDDKEGFAMTWLIIGPKENEALAESIVALEDGFIMEKEVDE